jgi:16S rRNA (guanine527-N7)-methyltransferase
MITAGQVEEAAVRWGLSELGERISDALSAYGNLLLHWNTRLSLTAIRDERELIERHLMEGVFAAAHHPAASLVLDFGSGTGIPGIPIALCRGDVHVTLAESQQKKASFLQEVIRFVQPDASVYAGRAETLAPGSFDAVWMRAVEKSALMLPMAAALVAPGGSLCLLGSSAPPEASPFVDWQWKTLPIPGSKDRVLHIGKRE